ncbi:MAG: hypothetical protein ACFFHV_07145, partial [Promethearchaeota archaeon]
GLLKLKQILILSLLILVIGCSSLNYTSITNIKNDSPMSINRDVPNLSDYIAWENNGTLVCNAKYDQFSPELICNSDGSVIITWHDNREGIQPDIYSQKVASNGKNIWIPNGTMINNKTGEQYEPQICSDGDGGAIIVWTDTEGDYNITAQRIASNGTVMWKKNGISVCNFTGNQEEPQICSDGNEGAIIAWQDWRDGNLDIYAQRLNSNGVKLWGINDTVICNATASQWNEKLCYNGFGDAIITWQDGRTGEDDIYAQMIDLDGNILWTKNGTAICNATNDQSDPQICCDGSGGAIITWTDKRGANWDIYAQRINSDESSLWTTNGSVICNATDIQEAPQICSDGSGGAIITWEDARDYSISDKDVYAQKIISGGYVVWVTNGVIVCNEFEDQYSIQICEDGLGGAIITWEDYRDSSTKGIDIYAQRITSRGTRNWIANGSIICNELDDQEDPRICYDGQRRVTITWYDHRGTNNDIYAQRIILTPPSIYSGDDDDDDEEKEEDNTVLIAFIGFALIVGIAIGIYIFYRYKPEQFKSIGRKARALGEKAKEKMKKE